MGSAPSGGCARGSGSTSPTGGSDRLGLDGRVPDHSTVTKNRRGRFRESGLMRAVFERVVGRRLEAGLASVEPVAVDGRFVRADASHTRCVPSAEERPREDASRAVREHLADLDCAAPGPAGGVRTPPEAVSLDLSRRRAERQARPLGLRPTRLDATVDTGSGVALEVQAAPERFADEPIAARRMAEPARAPRGGPRAGPSPPGHPGPPPFGAAAQGRRAPVRPRSEHHDGPCRLRLRGRRGADERVVLAATARNLGRMARWTGLPSWRAAMAA